MAWHALIAQNNFFLLQLSCAASIALYTSPLILPIAYRFNFFTLLLHFFNNRRGWMTEEGGFYMSKLLIGLSMVVAGAMLLRAFGRISNPAYTQVSGKPILEPIQFGNRCISGLTWTLILSLLQFLRGHRRTTPQPPGDDTTPSNHLKLVKQVKW